MVDAEKEVVGVERDGRAESHQGVGASKPRLVAEAVDAVASVHIVEVAAHNHVFAAVFGDVFFEGLDLVGTCFCRFGNFAIALARKTAGRRCRGCRASQYLLQCR